MINEKLAIIFSEMAILHDMKDEFFPARAYQKSVEVIGALSEDLRTIYKKGGKDALGDIDGIGKGLALKIEEYIKTGSIREFEKIKKEIPVDVLSLTKLDGVGPKTVKKLYSELGVKNISDLKKVVKNGKLKDLEGMGEKTQHKIAKSIEFNSKYDGRFLISHALPLAKRIVKDIERISGVKEVQYAGSVRRMQETIGDLDILVVAPDTDKVMEYIKQIDDIDEIIATGPTKTSVRLHNGIQVDVRVIKPESYGAALQYFTGDKYHNIRVRSLASDLGYKLNEYGLYRGDKIVAGKTEKEVYGKLGLKWIEPELRTNTGELEIARENKLPELIGYDDMKGDLQIQTDWTDGKDSIENCAKSARKKGLEYIAITDHTKSLAMTGGSDEKKLLRQMAEIDKVRKRVPEVAILKGAEVNIQRDGTLDINDDTLSKLDVVGVAVHSNFNMKRKDMTARIKKAIQNENADILFHPTGRRILRREPYDVDIKEVISVAQETKTILEIDAHPERLDLKDSHIRMALEAGAQFSIDSDAHSAKSVGDLIYGIGTARRAWLTKKDVINTRSVNEMLKCLK